MKVEDNTYRIDDERPYEPATPIDPGKFLKILKLQSVLQLLISEIIYRR